MWVERIETLKGYLIPTKVLPECVGKLVSHRNREL